MAGKCLVCALSLKKQPAVCLTVCLTPDARRDALRAKKKPVQRVQERAERAHSGSWGRHTLLLYY
nr:MAG TPA: hypothetical protein [Caudoviricetes sp.]